MKIKEANVDTSIDLAAADSAEANLNVPPPAHDVTPNENESMSKTEDASVSRKYI